jgi:hypothetical protein
MKPLRSRTAIMTMEEVDQIIQKHCVTDVKDLGYELVTMSYTLI